jgi:hypothetical protein
MLVSTMIPQPRRFQSEANSHLANSEFHHLLCGTQLLLLNLTNPVHILLPYFLNIDFNIIIPSCQGLQTGIFLLGFETNNLYAFLTTPMQIHVLPILLDFMIPVISGTTQIMKLLDMQLPPFSCYRFSLTSKYSCPCLLLNDLNILSSFRVRDQVSHP